MRTYLVWLGLGACNGFISGFFFFPLSWQFWVMTFVLFILLLIIEHKFFGGRF